MRKSVQELKEEISRTPTEGCPDCEQAGVCCANCWSNWMYALGDDKQARRRTLDELTAQAQELNMGYDDNK